MGIPDKSILDLIDKVKSWISWGSSDLASLSSEVEMEVDACRMCCYCDVKMRNSCPWYCCKTCSRVFCENCGKGFGSFVVDSKSVTDSGVGIQSCRFCSDNNPGQFWGKYSHKIHPAESPRQSPEPPSPNSVCEKLDGRNLQAVSVRRHPDRSDEDEADDLSRSFFSPYSLDTSSSASTRDEFYSFTSFVSSPSDSPSRIHSTSNSIRCSVQQEEQETLRSQTGGSANQDCMPVVKSPDKVTEESENTFSDLSIFRNDYKNLHKPLDFENNGPIWLPPPPDDENDDMENNFFSYDDEDDELGDSSAVFSSSDSLTNTFPEKDKHYENQKKPLRGIVQGHFRALVSQLLQEEHITSEEWLDIITSIAWQAANFVKPDTSRGGSMDPSDYVKVKCIASGNPNESCFVRGVVCTKNITHKRMIKQYKKPRLLILGGALEYHRAHNQLSSFDTLLQEEIDHLKAIVSRVEAHRPNVLLVEKSVSSYAQEFLLAKEISLVLNVKRPLLERIARCTGALITPSVDRITTSRLGQCEIFRLEKFCEEHEAANQLNKKPSKTLMFFEGCPRRLGCTVLLRGSCREGLKKVKHVVQYAVFAAYHLSLETSFLADEGASLPKATMKSSISMPELENADNTTSVLISSEEVSKYPDEEEHAGIFSKLDEQDQVENCSSSQLPMEGRVTSKPCEALAVNSAANVAPGISMPSVVPSDVNDYLLEESKPTIGQDVRLPLEPSDSTKLERCDANEISSEYHTAGENRQSILVSFSSHCVLNGNLCERARLLRIKFYGSFDKPLGRYLFEDVFDQAACCRSCKEPREAHVLCFTHQQGNLTINVKQLSSLKLPGARDGKIWMWHRCLRCAYVDGVPPATRRVVMSDPAWGLSFGKFLDLSFSNHATANRIASCGHSIQRDCLRFYGFGNTVAFFRYSPIDVLSVHLPPPVLQFGGHVQHDWLKEDAEELLSKTKALYEEISAALHGIAQKNTSLTHEFSNSSEVVNHIMELKDLVLKEASDYCNLLQPPGEGTGELGNAVLDVFQLNYLRHNLIMGFHAWDRRLYSLDSLVRQSSIPKILQDAVSDEAKYCRSDTFPKDNPTTHSNTDNMSESLQWKELPAKDLISCSSGFSESSVSQELMYDKVDEIPTAGKSTISLERAPSAASVLSDKIDSAWIGSVQLPSKPQFNVSEVDAPESVSSRQTSPTGNPHVKRLLAPTRVYSFDSAIRVQERIRKGLPPSSLYLSTLKSFHASGEYMKMVRDPLSSIRGNCSPGLPFDAHKIDLLLRTKPAFVSCASLLPKGARLLLPHSGHYNFVIAVYDNEPTSIISYALTSKEHEELVDDRPKWTEGNLNASEMLKDNPVRSVSPWKSFSSLGLDYIHYGSYGSEDAPMAVVSLFSDSKSSPHLSVHFEDESLNAGEKVKFSVTCYFAKEFAALRKKCCPTEVDYVRSLSRCMRWSAQGGKSGVYFAKSLDDRFIIKQVTKTELEAFEEFAPKYFTYLTDSLTSGSPTCLAKVIGIYQVTVKHMRGGKEAKMHVMVMENIFFKRSISRVYDLKGSERSRYNADTTGTNKTLLDMNLLESLRTNPIFLGSKAKRSLERAIWNDTSFLASIDVMDYSLLVGVDDEKKELVLGIIDFMRQYTWDKHLETWVKASGILGGPKNVSPTIVSPKQYKKRFRKAMTSYFLTVPDQWSS